MVAADGTGHGHPEVERLGPKGAEVLGIVGVLFGQRTEVASFRERLMYLPNEFLRSSVIDNGVRADIPSTARMRPASRSGLEALTTWYVKTYEERSEKE